MPPTIARSGGAASQSVAKGKAITAITYTASNATSIARSSGSFPTGVTGTVSGSSFIISGTPSATGTFAYAVTASPASGCTGSTASGTLTVLNLPPGVASTSSMSIGGLIWSANIQMHTTACTHTGSTADTPYPAYSGPPSWMYNHFCVVLVEKERCPNPWRLPTLADLNAWMAAVPNYETAVATGAINFVPSTVTLRTSTTRWGCRCNATYWYNGWDENKIMWHYRCVRNP